MASVNKTLVLGPVAETMKSVYVFISFKYQVIQSDLSIPWLEVT